MKSFQQLAAAAFLSGWLPMVGATASITQVELSNLAQPSSGQALVGSVSVTGQDFPSGTIPPANVTVTLQPATAGSGPTGTTTATSVVPISGTKERVVFQIPATIAVSAPTAYKVSIAGSTSTGAQFKSINSSALTVIPPSKIASLSPSSASAALSLPVNITGQYTNFVLGTTVASFGPYVSVGGAAYGAAGPVTVTSATTATAQITINAAAVTGPATVTVTTGYQQASLHGGFTIENAVTIININTSATVPVPPGFSGFNDPNLVTAVEYTDPKYIAMIQPMKPGFIRFPGGTESMAFDWQAAHENQSWINELAPNISAFALGDLDLAQSMAQAKGGVCFTATTAACYSNYADLVNTLSAASLVDVNGWTDTNPGSAANMVAAAKVAGLNVVEWELSNEPYMFPKIFSSATSYAASQFSYAQSIFSANPDAALGVFYKGEFMNFPATVNYKVWDNGMAAYKPHYWNSVSMHVYPINGTMTVSQEEQTLNGVLAHGTNEYITSYVAPLIGAETPLFITEMNSDGEGAAGFPASIYNGIFLAEYIARMSTASNIKRIAVHPLFLGNKYTQGIIRAVDDFQSYLLGQLASNPSYSTNTATNPDTQFEFYASASALALQVLNEAVNGSTFSWTTTVEGGPTVPILGFDGNPIPAVFAQGYQGANGTHYLVITNKSGASVPLAVEVNGTLGPASVTVSYISNPSDTAENTATDQTNIQVVNSTWANPMSIGPYSVTTLQW
jgi:hypothetical protein